MFGLGPMELIIIFLIILLVFGAKRIPEIAQGLGKGITEFKKAASDITNEFDVNKNASNNPNANAPRNELRGQQQAQEPQQRPVERPAERPPQQQQPAEQSDQSGDDKQQA